MVPVKKKGYIALNYSDAILQDVTPKYIKILAEQNSNNSDCFKTMLFKNKLNCFI